MRYFIRKCKAMYGQSPLQYRKDNVGGGWE